VLVQREMESWRTPLASITPFSAAALDVQCRGGCRSGQRLKLQLVSRRRSGWVVPIRRTLGAPVDLCDARPV